MEDKIKEAIEELNTYAWRPEGMKENPKGVPIEDVFILREKVLQLLSAPLEVQDKESQNDLWNEVLEQAILDGKQTVQKKFTIKRKE